MSTKVIRLKRWKVEVLPDDGENEPVNYTVIAVDEIDARIIAFCLDGGLEPADSPMEAGHVELVKMYTKVLEVSSA